MTRHSRIRGIIGRSRSWKGHRVGKRLISGSGVWYFSINFFLLRGVKTVGRVLVARAARNIDRVSVHWLGLFARGHRGEVAADQSEAAYN